LIRSSDAAPCCDDQRQEIAAETVEVVMHPDEAIEEALPMATEVTDEHAAEVKPA